MASCRTSCGNLTIPFPFCTSSDCNLDEAVLITCNHSYDPPKPFLNLGSVEVLDISLDGLMKVASSVASDCYDKSGSQINGTTSELTLSKFPISSTQNKFTAFGCDTHALTDGSDEWKRMSAGCVSWCDSINSTVNGTCFGIGCCQTSISKWVRDFLVDIRSFRNHTRVKSFNPCGYAFVVETEAFQFSTTHLKDLQNTKIVPVVLDWSVGNVTCLEARKNLSTYACRATHSECSDASNGIGYNCNCLTGFQGNPYLVDGCEGFMIPAVGSCWIFWRRKQKKVVKLRLNLFRRSGGLLLNNNLPTFTVEDLKMATDNYDEKNIILRQHSGISYKGILIYGSQVIIKASNVPGEWDTEVFISKLSTLSKIRHRNVVKLIGYCLETQFPVLVYEFVTIETLFDRIHNDALAFSLSCNMQKLLKCWLNYVHSTASVQIIHGNLKSQQLLHITKPCLYRKKAVNYERPRGEEFSARYFVSSVREENLISILDCRIEIDDKTEQLTEVAKLAEKCLSDSSVERPTVKEVAIALESMKEASDLFWKLPKTLSPNSCLLMELKKELEAS
ncbi:hypothetical protein BUALT_Bualt08G0110900 [Buddleja alternifolia]|uniref:Protein kinase domain-containing protein n=1 Tax=Buddleja alternifolia TaxID=168488 RepID=A0AAV6X6Y4_9LAMI|nr:hypothetical protein BUALT_Bualt08G0110900 [Buddleja alternifolia]